MGNDNINDGVTTGDIDCNKDDNNEADKYI